MKKKIKVKIIETFQYELSIDEDTYNKEYIKDNSIASEIKFVEDNSWIDDDDAPKRKHLKKKIIINKTL